MPLCPLRALAMLTIGLALASAAGRAQDDPPATVRVRIVGEADGAPRPGVLLHVLAEPPPDNPLRADGFLVHEAREVRRLRAARTVRTDPAGEADLPWAVAGNPRLVFAGEPYTLLGEPPTDDGVLVWPALAREPVGVRVVDTERRPVADFPVALHAGGRDLSFALTDREGRAVLGMPPEFTARLHLAPAGWIGPRDGMPTVATTLAGRRGAELVLPPFGALRLRAVRGGKPALVRLGSFAVRLTDEYQWQANGSATGECAGLGFELPRVAVGVALTGHADLLDRQELRVAGPERHGEVRLVDLEVPWHPVLRGRVTGLPAPPGRLPVQQVQLTLTTDRGAHHTSAAVRADGHLDAGAVLLRGTRLHRVDLDLPAPRDGEPVAFAGSQACDLDLSRGELDLGALPMQAVAPLHGRVVDAAGAPLAGIAVTAEAQPAGDAYQLTTDAAGQFVWRMRLPRHADGQLQPIRATARRGRERSEPVLAAPDHGPITLVLAVPPTAPPAAAPAVAAPAPRRRDQGRVTVVLVDTEAVPGQLSALTLVSTQGFARSPTATMPGPNGTARVEFTGLAAGRYTLTAPDPQHIRRFLLHRLDVPDAGECQDPRLARVSLAQGLAVRRIQVVDAQRVPIAGAMVSGPGFHWPTDGTGSVRFASHDSGPLPGRVEARGHRIVEIADLTDGLVVQPPVASALRIRVTGLPADLPRERLGIWVRHEQRERLEGPQAGLDGDGVATVPTPLAANYVLWLLVYPPGPRTDPPSHWQGVAIRPEPVAIGADPPAELTWALDAATVDRLRRELAPR